MSDYTPKEKVTGCYEPTSLPISFNRVWGSHTFTDEEVAKLLKGESISFQAMSKAGKPYIANGKLEEQEYNENKFWGFKLDTEAVPASWCDHVFTQQEIDTLKSGGSIYVQDCVSKKSGRTFACTLKFGMSEGKKKIIPDFGNNN